MNWISLNDLHQIDEIRELSKTRPQLIFKHSTRCSVSSMAKNRLERSVQPEQADFYFLDLIKFRALSDKVASDFDVYHESPQVILIRNNECVYEESHNGINMDDIEMQVNLS